MGLGHQANGFGATGDLLEERVTDVFPAGFCPAVLLPEPPKTETSHEN